MTSSAAQIDLLANSNATRDLHDEELPLQMLLELNVLDRDVIGALAAQQEGEDRDEFALAALKIGVLALRHAGSRMDGDLIQRETTRMLQTLESQFQNHARTVHERLTGELKIYFDPKDGRFHERVERLVKQGGELESVLKQHVGDDDSALAATLLSHFGENSPLMKVLSPDQSKGLMATLQRMLEGELQSQRDKLLEQFSLNNEASALSRLRKSLIENQGEVSKGLRDKVDEVVQQFSFNDENSSISRFARILQNTQNAINENLSLDKDNSPLSRLKKEMMTILGAQAETNSTFQEEVKVALGKLVATREESARSTRHGLEFEDAVNEFVLRTSQAAGDLAESVGNSVGVIRNCKIGDCVVTLGPESAAPEAKIVIEAKQDASYTLSKAREEIRQARDNRQAQLGLFVFSKKSAPAGLEPFARYGDDLCVIWDAEDPATDVILLAGLTTARALTIRAARSTKAQTADFEAIEKAILEIQRRTDGLDEVRKNAETIQNASNNILERVRKNRQALERQIDVLRERTDDLKEASGDGS